MSVFIRFIAFLIFIAVVLLGFTFSNYNTTEVSLWIGVNLAPQRVGVWIIIAFILGGLMGLLLGFGLFKRIQSHVLVLQLRSRLKSTEKQLAKSRSAKTKDST